MAQLDAHCRQAYEAWEKSKAEHKRRRHRRIEHEPTNGDAGSATTLVEATVTSREGDPRYAAQALRAIQEKRIILQMVGGNAPPEPTFERTERRLRQLTVPELEALNRLTEARLSGMTLAEFCRVARPEDLHRLAEIIKKEERGAYEDAEEDPSRCKPR
jgi:hypothetical protein